MTILSSQISDINSVPAEVQAYLNDPTAHIIVAFSGGKDSVALVLRLLELGIDKSRITLHHHDVDGEGLEIFDWTCTISYCEAFAKAFDLPLVMSGREGGIIREIYRKEEGLQNVYYYDNGQRVVLESRKGSSTKYKFPAVAADLTTRWCSSVAKIDVLARVINNTIATGKVLVLTGERRQESAARSKYKEFETYRSNTKKRNCLQWRAVIDFSEEQVWDLFRKYSVQPHPCYMLGWSRCSCLTCIFSSSNTWASIYQLDSDRVHFLANVEKEIGHTLYTTKERFHACDDDTKELMYYKNGNPMMRSRTVSMPLMEKVSKGTSFIKPENLARWGKEATGEFTSPIFIENWVLPAGAFGEEASGSL